MVLNPGETSQSRCFEKEDPARARLCQLFDLQFRRLRFAVFIRDRGMKCEAGEVHVIIFFSTEITSKDL